MKGILELGVRKAIEESEISRLFCKSLEDKNFESNAKVEAWIVTFKKEV